MFLPNAIEDELVDREDFEVFERAIVRKVVDIFEAGVRKVWGIKLLQVLGKSTDGFVRARHSWVEALSCYTDPSTQIAIFADLHHVVGQFVSALFGVLRIDVLQTKHTREIKGALGSCDVHMKIRR